MLHDVTPSVQQMFTGAIGNLGKGDRPLIEEQPQIKRKVPLAAHFRGLFFGSCCSGRARLSVLPLLRDSFFMQKSSWWVEVKFGEKSCDVERLEEKGFSSAGFVRWLRVGSCVGILDAVSVLARDGCQGACKSMKLDHSPRYLQDCIWLNLMCGTWTWASWLKWPLVSWSVYLVELPSS